MNENNEIPETDAPKTEKQLIEEIIEEDPELARAFERAQNGVYDHTLLQMWESQLIDQITGHKSLAAMSIYENFLTTWPWLGYANIDKTRGRLAELLEEALQGMYEAIDEIAGAEKPSRTREEVFASNETDWESNSEIYREVVARWSALSNLWGDRWQFSNMRDKPLLHVAASIATASLIGTQGLVEQMRHLQGFTFSEKEQGELSNRTVEILREMGYNTGMTDDEEGTGV